MSLFVELHKIPGPDLEDFIFNRTTGKPSSIFKKLGDATKLYCSTTDTHTVRLANIRFRLSNDIFNKVVGLSSSKVKILCTASVFKKSKRFEVVKSELISTQVFDTLNKIEGEFRAATFHDQVITWGESAANSPLVPFDNLTLHASCSCKYHIKMVEEKTSHVRKYCTHIIGQLRRVIFMTN